MTGGGCGRWRAPPANRKGVWGSAVSSPYGVWGEAPAALIFSLFLVSKTYAEIDQVAGIRYSNECFLIKAMRYCVYYMIYNPFRTLCTKKSRYLNKLRLSTENP